MDDGGARRREGPIRARRSAMRIASVYSVLAVSWITITDLLVIPIEYFPSIQTIKALVFVAVTSVLLYLFVQAQMLSEERLLTRSERERRLAHIGEVTTGIAHEFGNELVGLRMLVSRLRGTAADAPAEGIVGEIDAGLARVQLAVREILDYGKPIQPNRTPVAMKPWLEAFVSSIRPQVRDEIELVVSVEPPSLVCSLDEDLLRHVLMNLMLNAAQAIDGRGTIELSVRRGRGAIRIRVSDTGRGVPADLLAVIFDPFVTRRPGGIGLGLPIAQRIIAAHGGEITVAATSPEGTTFEIELPDTK